MTHQVDRSKMPRRRRGDRTGRRCLAEDSSSLVRVSDAGLAVDAAAAGLGRATVPELVARGDIAAGRVIAIGEPRDAQLGYWLVAPLPQWRQKKVKALVDALAAGSRGYHPI